MLTPLPHSFLISYWLYVVSPMESQLCWTFSPQLVLLVGWPLMVTQPDTMLCTMCFFHIWKWQKGWACDWLVSCRRQNLVPWMGTVGHSVLLSSVAQSCLTLCDPTDCSMPGFPVYHQLLELVQTHVHLVSDAIQPSHPLSSPSPVFNLSQHQGLFQRVCS